MKARTISIIIVVILAALAGSYLDDFFVLKNAQAASWGRIDYPSRTYGKAPTMTITVDSLAIRLFERKIIECTPWRYNDEGIRLGITTEALFDYVYESLSEKAKEKYDRDEAYAMIDIALDNLAEDSVIGYEDEQWRLHYTNEYPMKHWTDLSQPSE